MERITMSNHQMRNPIIFWLRKISMIVAIGYSVVLTACTNGTSSLNVPSPLFAYVADFSNNLWQCPMNTLGQFSGGCTALKNSTTPFNTTTSTSFATFGGVNYAYVNDSTSNL